MACDIHAYLEFKPEKVPHRDLDWEGPLAFTVDRNYELFGVLAGVRRDGPPIAELRGLPTDMSIELETLAESDPGHSASWLSFAEIEGAMDRIEATRDVGYEEMYGRKFPPLSEYWELARAWMKMSPGHDCRLVFWFDS